MGTCCDQRSEITFLSAEISHLYTCSCITFPLHSDCLEHFCSRLVIDVIGREQNAYSPVDINKITSCKTHLSVLWSCLLLYTSHLYRFTVTTCLAAGWGCSDRPPVTSGQDQSGRLTPWPSGPLWTAWAKAPVSSPCPSATAQPAPSNAVSTSVTFGCCSVKLPSSQVRWALECNFD